MISEGPSLRRHRDQARPACRRIRLRHGLGHQWRRTGNAAERALLPRHDTPAAVLACQAPGCRLQPRHAYWWTMVSIGVLVLLHCVSCGGRAAARGASEDRGGRCHRHAGGLLPCAAFRARPTPSRRRGSFIFLVLLMHGVPEAAALRRRRRWFWRTSRRWTRPHRQPGDGDRLDDRRRLAARARARRAARRLRSANDGPLLTAAMASVHFSSTPRWRRRHPPSAPAHGAVRRCRQLIGLRLFAPAAPRWPLLLFSPSG